MNNADRRLQRLIVRNEKRSRARGSRRDPGQRRRYFERLIDERHIRTVLGLAFQGWDRGYYDRQPMRKADRYFNWGDPLLDYKLAAINVSPEDRRRLDRCDRSKTYQFHSLPDFFGDWTAITILPEGENPR